MALLCCREDHAAQILAWIDVCLASRRLQAHLSERCLVTVRERWTSPDNASLMDIDFGLSYFADTRSSRPHAVQSKRARGNPCGRVWALPLLVN